MLALIARSSFETTYTVLSSLVKLGKWLVYGRELSERQLITLMDRRIFELEKELRELKASEDPHFITIDIGDDESTEHYHETAFSPL